MRLLPVMLMVLMVVIVVLMVVVRHLPQLAAVLVGDMAEVVVGRRAAG